MIVYKSEKCSIWFSGSGYKDISEGYWLGGYDDAKALAEKYSDGKDFEEVWPLWLAHKGDPPLPSIRPLGPWRGTSRRYACQSGLKEFEVQQHDVDRFNLFMDMDGYELREVSAQKLEDAVRSRLSILTWMESSRQMDSLFQIMEDLNNLMKDILKNNGR